MAKFADDELSNTVEEISRHPSIQAVACLSLASFSQLYNKNWKQVRRSEIFEKLAVWPQKDHV
jgi:hypothetical protein